MVENRILIDYLTMSFKRKDEKIKSESLWAFDKTIYNYEFIISALNLDRDGITVDGEYTESFYIEKSRLIKMDYCILSEIYEGVKVHYNPETVVLELSGKGCRTVEKFNPGWDWFRFIHSFDTELRAKEAHISRLDVAFDDFCGLLDIMKMQKYIFQKKYVCLSSKNTNMFGDEECIYFGSSQSDRRLRIYNKALEQGIVGMHWVRCEFQLRNDNATSFYLNWCENADLKYLFLGIIKDYLRFTTQPITPEVRQNHHQDRVPTAPFWSSFLKNVDSIEQKYLPIEEYTLENLRKYLEKQCASSFKAYAKIASERELLEIVYNSELSKKQKKLIQQIKKEQEEKNDSK